jgi:phosphate acetyltransferase
MDFLAEQERRISGVRVRIVYPEGSDERVVTAAAEVARRGLAVPILLGAEQEVAACGGTGRR